MNQSEGKRVASRNSPSFALILLTYNQREYVGDAVRSVLAQRCDPIEILISDDCSADETFEAAKRAVNGYSGPHRVRLNMNPVRMGLAKHFTHCVGMVEHEWIICAAGDDISRHDRAAKIMSVVRKMPQLDGVGSMSRTIDKRGSPLKTDRDGVSILLKRLLSLIINTNPWTCTAQEPQARRLVRHLIDGRPQLAGATAAWRKELITGYPAIGDGCAEDYALNFRAAIGGGTFTIMDRLIDYRMHASNLWGTDRTSMTDAELRAAHDKQRRFLVAGISQNLIDVSDAVDKGKLPSALADQAEAILRARQSLIDCEMYPDPATAAALAEYLMKLAYFVSRHAQGTRFPRNAIVNRALKAFADIQGWIVR